MKRTIILASLCLAISAPAFAIDPEQLSALADKKIKTMDIDGDGKVSHDEFFAYEENKFRDNDTDHDGFLSHDEMVQIKAKDAANMGMK